MKIERRPLSPAGQALQCTRAMAQAMSVDLSELLYIGGLSTSEYAEMITRCRGCAQSTACADWLEARKRGEHADLPSPHQCENREVLNRFAQAFE
jgi:hypothetical protein